MFKVEKFIKGYKSFFHNYFVVNPAIYKELVRNGQSPTTLIVACCDSRIEPAIVTKSAPGEIFVERNVANIVPSYDDDERNHAVGAALEFAVNSLEVAHIIVKGHSDCGGINALINQDIGKEFPMVSRWVGTVRNAVEEEKSREVNDKKDNLHRRCEQAGIKQSFKNLRTYPFIKEREQAGKIKLHGWYFNLETGHISDYDESTDKFVQLI